MDHNQIIEATLITEWRTRLGQLPGGEAYDGGDLKGFRIAVRSLSRLAVYP